MVIKKSRRAIATDDVDRTFDDRCIQKLAKISNLPHGTDLKVFAEGVRQAVRIYASDARKPNRNELHVEIANLYSAAVERRYDEVAILMEKLSLTARELLRNRGAASRLGVELPSAVALRDAGQQEGACQSIASLCQFGGRYIEGRRRSSGKRSCTWRPLLYAPERSRAFQKRDAERNLLLWLSLAWLEGTGKAPARTARHSTLGPFARLIRECLRLVGSPGTDAVELINEAHRRRREMEAVAGRKLAEDEIIAVT